MLDNLKKYNILLASKSPRRRELLQQLRIPFHIITIGGIDESYPATVPPLEVAQYISNKKADVYQQRIIDDEMIITADTLVICDDEIMGKPKDADEAVEMLRKLSGKWHKVATGVAITTKDRRTSFTTVSEVKFAPLDDAEIRYYVDNYAPFDKAGAYGIQERGALLVSGIRGDYCNVVGLPVFRLGRMLAGLGVDLLGSNKEQAKL